MSLSFSLCSPFNAAFLHQHEMGQGTQAGSSWGFTEEASLLGE